jgi:hypothetical protein
VPIYSLDSDEYRARVHCNDRGEDQVFPLDELLFRRYPRAALVNGMPTPLIIPIEENSGVSVNRGRYSLPQDVLEPDCCQNNTRPSMVVLEFAVEDVPTRIAAHNREYIFAMKHVPEDRCYAHSEIWCNSSGDLQQPCEKPSKTIRDLFRAQLLSRMASMGRKPREFAAVNANPA